MRQDERAPFAAALEEARRSAYPPGEFVDQESFMRAGEILELARRAAVAPRVSVLDLCCGIAGPGRLIVAELGCDYLGVDYSADAVAIARERSRRLGLDCRFQVSRIPPLPPGRFDVVLLLETLLAFEDKATLLHEVAGALAPGGRFALTVEEGAPLSPAERQEMPDADTVWPVPLAELVGLLGDVGLEVTWRQECSRPHLEMVDSLARAFSMRENEIAAHIGRRALGELLAAHALWSTWLRSGRVRKFAMVVSPRSR